MSILKLIHADNFFIKEEVEKLKNVVDSLTFVDKEYGLEIDHFNLLTPGIDKTFSDVLNQKLTIDEEKSGIFRKPMNCIIHFEAFDSLNEWCFVVALERTTFNLYHHVSGAKSALDGYKFNYRNLFEWDYDVNILLQPNQGIFFRPWLFHSLENGIIQYYKILTEEKNV